MVKSVNDLCFIRRPSNETFVFVSITFDESQMGVEPHLLPLEVTPYDVG